MTDLEKEIRNAKPEYERMPSAFKARLRNQLQAQARPTRLRHIDRIGSVAGVIALLVVALFGWLVYTQPIGIIEEAAPTNDVIDVEDEVVAVFGEILELHEIELHSEKVEEQNQLPVSLTWKLTQPQIGMRVNLELWGSNALLQPTIFVNGNHLFSTELPVDEAVTVDYMLEVPQPIEGGNFYLVISVEAIESAELLPVQGDSTSQYLVNTQEDSVTRWDVPIATTLLATIPDSEAGAKIAQTFAQEFVREAFKPVAAGALRELYATSTTKLPYGEVVDLLGATAHSTYGGSNIIHIAPVESDAELWFVQIVGIFSTDSFKPQYYTVAISENRQIVAAGSAEKPIIDEVRDVHGQTLANTEIFAYPSGERLATASELGFFTLESIPAGQQEIVINDAIVTIPEGAGTLDLGDLRFQFEQGDRQLTLINNLREEGVYWFESAETWLSIQPTTLYFFPVQSPHAPNCDIVWQETQFVDPCTDHRWNSAGDTLEDSNNPDLSRYWLRQRERMVWVEVGDVRQTPQPLDVTPMALHGITLTIREFNAINESSSIRTAITVDPVWGGESADLQVESSDAMLWDQDENDVQLGDEWDQGKRQFATGEQLFQQIYVAHNGIESASQLTLQLSLRLLRVEQTSTLAINFNEHQAGDIWETDYIVSLGLAAVRVTQVEWMDTAEDGSKRVRLYFEDGSPEGMSLDCAGVVITIPTEVSCKPLGEWTLAQRVQDGQPLEITIHGNVTFDRPWQVVWEVE